MFCPYCDSSQTRVLESRVYEDSMRRRRECIDCTSRFTTYEKASFNLKVCKKDGRIENYVFSKLANSFVKACPKIDEKNAKELALKVQQKVLLKKSSQIQSAVIGKLVLGELKKYDKMGYLRFASIYKQIDDPKQLGKELESIY
jgi:transcriptional repressor NrdR